MASSSMALGGARVVLTGASGGLGGAIAHALDDKGARLVLSGRRRDRLEALAAELRDADVEPCDFADRQAVTTFAQSIEDADVLVANAALPGAGTLDDFTPAEIDRVLDVNLRAPILLSRHLAPLMTARRRGQLVFVSSMGAKLPVSRIAVYSATKSGLRGFAACLRQELTGTGVGVSVVFPGSVRDAGMFADSGATGGGGTVTSAAVAAGVVRAIEHDKAEVDVAPAALRVMAVFANLAPDALAWLVRRGGADKQTAALAEGLRDRR
jgi:uncharacterized protein